MIESPKQPKIVAIGGGTGLSVMLRGLKEKPVDITAIVTVGDDGGSSGVLRKELEMPPPGDIRNVLSALADVEPLMSYLLQYRFNKGEGLAGHSLGNLILAAVMDHTKDFVLAIKELSRILAVRGQVLPAANQAVALSAKLKNGSVIHGESDIPKANSPIQELLIEPKDVEPLPEAVAAIEQADAIVVGPGSLYTSLLPNLLVPKLTEAIRKSKAVKVFICNVMTQPGETDNYSVSDHLEAVSDHVNGKLFDYVIVNNGEIPPYIQEQYAQQYAKPVQLDFEKVENNGYQVIADHLVLFKTYLRHDAEKLSTHIYKLVENWVERKE